MVDPEVGREIESRKPAAMIVAEQVGHPRLASSNVATMMDQRIARVQAAIDRAITMVRTDMDISALVVLEGVVKVLEGYAGCAQRKPCAQVRQVMQGVQVGAQGEIAPGILPPRRG